LHFFKLSSGNRLYSQHHTPDTWKSRLARRRALRLDALMVAAGVLLLPAVCLAWGPASHVDFGLRVLDSLLLLPPVVRRLL